MRLTSSKQRRAVAGAIGATSVILALVTNEPSGLLVAIGAVSICIGWKEGLAAIAVASLISSVTLLSPEYGSANNQLL